MKNPPISQSVFSSGFGRLVLMVALSFLVAAIVVIGVSAFYPTPQSPMYPDTPVYSGVSSSTAIAPSPVYQQELGAYNIAQAKYDSDYTNHAKWAFIIIVGLAVALMLLSLVVSFNRYIFNDSVLLSGIFLVIYSLTYTNAGVDLRFEFGAGLVALVALLIVMYQRFMPTPAP